jgi:hypothetical protein
VKNDSEMRALRPKLVKNDSYYGLIAFCSSLVERVSEEHGGDGSIPSIGIINRCNYKVRSTINRGVLRFKVFNVPYGLLV